MTDDFTRDPLAEDLKRSLATHAAEAPAGDLLAERIIHATDQQSAAARDARRPGWRTWALPVVAAAAVGAVVAAVVVIQDYHPGSSPPPAGSNTAPRPTLTSPTAPKPTSAVPPPNAADLKHLKLLDLTFVSEDEGWALGSADCIGKPGRCTALLHTTDGAHWQAAYPTPFNVPGVAAGCTYRCVSYIRFANPRTGYLFGVDAFLMTTDGGKHWQPQPGGAILLETLDNNVIRVTSTGTGCPSWCDVQVETSAIGSTTWTPAELGSTPGNGVQLSRGGHNAYLLFPGHVAGGAQQATSVLYRSANDGLTWTSSGEPCPQLSAEDDSIAVAAGGGDEVSVLCQDRLAGGRSFVATSADAGAHFTAQPGSLPRTMSLLTGDPTTVLVAGGDGLARSTDGGRSWHTVPDVAGQIAFLGFESRHVGRAVTLDNTVWTTRDGGRSWTPAKFQ